MTDSLPSDNPSKRRPDETGFLPTRSSLLNRVKNPDDRAGWQTFYDLYWRLVYGFARKTGLTDEEAKDAAQETMIAVSRNIGDFQYDRGKGSFKGWLLTNARWRIADQLRKRSPGSSPPRPTDDGERRTATIERIPDQAPDTLDARWDAEWHVAMVTAALERLKNRLDPLHVQIFECHVLKGWPPDRVKAELGVSRGQVYLVKHRVGALVRKEVRTMDRLTHS